MDASEQARWQEIDAEIVAAGKSIKVLSALEWPPELGAKFLDEVRRGDPRLPEPPVLRIDHGAEIEALGTLIDRLSGDDPIERFLRSTAESYETTARMLEAAGTPRFCELGLELYGSPEQKIARTDRTVLEAAEQFLTHTAELSAAESHTEADYCITAATVENALKDRAAQVFTHDSVSVVRDPKLSSKAAAGAQRVRVRDATCFTREDVPQLVEHELMVHTLTAINGRAQPSLTSFGVGAPRTTTTQEGLAVFAELITGSMDLSRLRRLALRPKALKLALDGADFIEVFRFFSESGQTEGESYLSTYRLFRGGDVRGSVAFPKDGIYLHGLLAVHTFLRKAMEERKLHYTHDLFAGRMALRDVLELEEFFRSGYIQPPRYEPEWVSRRSQLASFLAYSDFVHGLDLSSLELTDLVKRCGE